MHWKGTRGRVRAADWPRYPRNRSVLPYPSPSHPLVFSLSTPLPLSVVLSYSTRASTFNSPRHPSINFLLLNELGFTSPRRRCCSSRHVLYVSILVSTLCRFNRSSNNKRKTISFVFCLILLPSPPKQRLPVGKYSKIIHRRRVCCCQAVGVHLIFTFRTFAGQIEPLRKCSVTKTGF